MKKQNTEDKKIFDTELFRAYKGEKGDYDKEEGKEINYKGMKIKLSGFTIVGKENKPYFFYKWKHENRGMLLLVIEENIPEEEKETVSEAVEMLKLLSLQIGYSVIDMKESLDSMIIQEKSMGKFFGEDKEKKK